MLQKAIFGAGCFWGIEAAFRQVPGVKEALVGYSGGESAEPTYREVCSGRTGHAEVVEVEFDPEVVSFDALLDVFWQIHNPMTLNRQGPDIGTQYRSAIFTLDDEQARQAEESKTKMAASGHFPRPIVTEITKASPFYRAEEYHQRYFEKHGDDRMCRSIDHEPHERWSRLKPMIHRHNRGNCSPRVPPGGLFRLSGLELVPRIMASRAGPGGRLTATARAKIDDPDLHDRRDGAPRHLRPQARRP